MSPRAMYMTIRADNVYRQYQADQDPKKLFEKANEWITTIRKVAHEHEDLVAKEIQEALIRAIFGSNLIERAGLGLEATVHLCRKVFAGETVVDTIGEQDTKYEDRLLLALYRLEPSLKDKLTRDVLRGRAEVVQHAKAYQYLLNAFVTEKKDLTEEIIKETHQILTTGVPIVQKGMEEVPSEAYAGKYRSVVVGAGTTNFSVPKFIPAHMAEMCKNLKDDLDKAEASGEIDPFSTAARYSMTFVQIHPFQDGNGRMCRMILNAILCRFAGVVIPIGEQAEEREEYMGIKRRASEEMEGHGEYATFVLKRSVTRLRELKKKLAGKNKGAGSN